MNKPLSSLPEYRQACASIDAAYGTLLASRLIPFSACSIEALHERRRTLSSGRFQVAVCGQTKAGKSTLVNALVLESPVLPSDDTPMTAKITVLRHRATPGIEAQLWTREEWNQLKQSYQTDPQLSAEFEREVTLATQRGYPEGSWISGGGRVLCEDGHDGLSKFVSVVERGGVLSPYVKHVLVFHTVRAFAEVDVVDTPGINDPNKLRSAVTEQWIHAADAVIYVSYAGQPMAQADLHFIRTHLGGVSESKRVLAINKIDLVERSGVESYVDSLRRSPSAEVAAIMAPREQTSFVAAGARLLRQARAAGITMEGLEWPFPDDQWLRDDHDGMDALRAMVEQRLMAKRGDDVIEAHRRFLSGLVVALERDLAIERDDFEKRRETLSLKASEVSERQDALHEHRVRVDCVLEELRSTVQDIGFQACKRIKSILILTLDRLQAEIANKVCGFQTLSELEFRTLGAFQLAWDAHGRSGLETVLRVVADTRQAVEDLANDKLRSLGNNAISERRLKLALDRAMTSVLENAEERARMLVKSEQIRDAIHEATNFFSRFFNSGRPNRDAQERVLGEFSEAMIGLRSRLAEQMRELVTVGLDGLIASIERDLRIVGETRERDLDKVLTMSAQQLTREQALVADLERVLREREDALALIIQAERSARVPAAA